MTGKHLRNASTDLLHSSLAKAIHAYVKKNRLSLAEVARRARFKTPHTLWAIVNNKRHSISTTTLFVLAYALGTKASELLALAEQIAVKEHLAMKVGRTALANIKQKKEPIMSKHDDKDEAVNTPEEENEEESEGEEEEEETDDDEEEEEEEDDDEEAEET